MKKLFIFIVFLSLLFSCHVRSSRKSVPNTNETILDLNGTSFKIEIARTTQERAKGLMNRDKLEWNEGMLFIFDVEQELSFWMKNTRIPLSIIYIDRNGVITDKYDMKPFSLSSVRSTRKCLYAIEANQGFFKQAGLSVGSKINLGIIKAREI